MITFSVKHYINTPLELMVPVFLGETPVAFSDYTVTLASSGGAGTPTFIGTAIAAGYGHLDIDASEFTLREPYFVWVHFNSDQAEDVMFYVDMAAKVIVPPSSGDLCRVYGNIANLGLDTDCVTTTEIVFEIVTPDSAGPSPSIITSREVAVTPDQAGDFEADLARGAEVRVVIQKAGVDETFTVPDQESEELTNLITA